MQHLKYDNINKNFLEFEIKSENLFAAGYENHPFQFISGSIPKVFEFPGIASISYASNRAVDLPNDLVMKFQLRKVAPFTYDVPCTNGQGSWYSSYFKIYKKN